MLGPYLSPLSLGRQLGAALLLRRTTGWRHFGEWASSRAWRSIPAAAGAVGMGCIGYGYHAVWEATRACNLRCAHCHARSSHPASGELDTASARRMIRDIAAVGRFRMLVFSGGEPLLRPDIDELLLRARSAGLVTVLATNGTLVDRPRAAELRRLGVACVAVSIDSHRAGVHNALRRDERAFTLAVTALEACRAEGLATQVNFTAMKTNLPDVSGVARLCGELGADIMLCYQLVPMGRAGALAGQSLGPIENRCLVDAIRRLQRDSRAIIEPVAAPQYWPHLLGRDRPHERRMTRPTFFHGCAAGWGLVYIKPDGEVWPCPFVPVSGGNVREQPLVDIWRAAPIFTLLRDRDNLHGRCGRCPSRRICGGCRGKAYAATGSALAEDPTCYLHHRATPVYRHAAACAGETACEEA